MRNILIVFTDPHLSYSPSTLNLYDALSEQFKVTILAFEPNVAYSTQKVINRNVKYLSSENYTVGVPLFKRLTNEIKSTLFKGKNEITKLITPNAQKLINEISIFNGEVIAVDFFALWCVQQSGKEGHFFSLEIKEHDAYRDNCNLSQVKSVIIQTQPRYNYLFKGLEIKTFLIQNAPNYLDGDLGVDIRDKNKLVFCGSAMPFFGIYSCIEFIKDYPEYSLTVKGAIPLAVKNLIDQRFNELIVNGQLILDENYLEPEQLNEFLKKYYIGFVFYDYFRFEFINTFNYQTAPSGKLFQYYNAGVPVIACNLEGLNTIDAYNAGIMVDSFGSKTIKNAIEKISAQYQTYSEGAKQASRNFDFKENVKPFIRYMESL